MPELTSLGSVIKETYESEPNTNAFTDAEKSKLASINPEDIGVVKSVNSKTGEVVLTAADVGALPDSYTPPAAPVQSVNSKTGAVTLTHEDVGALPDDYEPPVTSVNGQTGDVTIGISDISGLQLLLEDLESRLEALEEDEPGGED